jgi:hypothetical protein
VAVVLAQALPSVKSAEQQRVERTGFFMSYLGLDVVDQRHRSCWTGSALVYSLHAQCKALGSVGSRPAKRDDIHLE